MLTHPQVPGQCERSCATSCAHATVLPASSTAEAVRTVVAAGDRRAGGARDGTGGGDLRRDGDPGGGAGPGRQRNAVRVARPVWRWRRGCGCALGRGRRTHTDPPLRTGARQSGWKTSLVFWGPGADSPGWLVRCLDEFGRREINLTKIESRPERERMGSYMFFVDLQGRCSDAAVAEAIRGLEAGSASRSRARLLPCERCSRRCAGAGERPSRGCGDGVRTYGRSSETRHEQSPRLRGAIATLRRYRWIAPFHL